MAKIYAVPKLIKVPQINFKNFNYKEHKKNQEEFINNLKQHLNDLGYTENYVGEVIRFPVADGYSQYMVFNLKPVSLIHLPLDDAYEFEYAHLLNKTEVLKKIKGQKEIEKLFS